MIHIIALFICDSQEEDLRRLVVPYIGGFMSWMQTIKSGISRGRNAIVCTGSITDGFPGTDLADTYHSDQLVNWQQYMCEAIPHVHGWTFDPAFGFQFHNEDSEKAFHALLKGESAPGADDAISSARQSVRENTLPSDPDAALRLMRRVMDRMKRSDFANTQVRCLILLPNLDTWCGRPQGQMTNTNTTALLLEHMLTHTAYKTNRIVFAFSTTVMEGLHERLRNKHVPIYRVHIPVPSEETRRAFLSGLCNHEQRELRELIAKTKEDLGRALERIVAESTKQHRETKVAIKDVDAQIRMKAPQSRSVKRAVADFDAAVEIRDGTRKAQQQDAGLAALNEQITHLTLRTNRRLVHVVPSNAQTVMSTLCAGDAFFVQSGTQGMMVVDRVAATGVFSLSAVADGRQLLGADNKANQYRFHVERTRDEERLSMEVRTATGGWSVFHAFQGMDFAKFPLHVPKADVESFLRLDELERKRSNFDAVNDMMLKQADDRVEKANEAITNALRKQFPIEYDARDYYLKTVERAAHYAKHPEEHPEAVRIAVLIQAQEARLKQLLDRGYCPIPEQGLIQAASDLHGLGFRQICTLLTDSRESQVPITRKEILRTRIELLQQSYGHLFEIVEPTYGFEGIGGLDYLKEYFASVRDAVLAMEYRVVPMGIMLMGPPGTGKTGLAEAFARECGFLFVKIRNTKSMWVGESERIAAEMFAALRDLAPVVVLRDEVDQQDAKRDGFQGDSGVSSNLLASWMQFLSDPTIRGRVVVVNCTNRPDLMDAAMTRSGRTDDCAPVLMPGEKERESVFGVMVSRYRFPCNIDSFASFAKMTAGRSGADIEVIVRRAFQNAVAKGGSEITPESLTWAIEDFCDHSSAEDVARMTLLALRATSSRRFLPSNWQEVEKSCREILEKGNSESVIIIEAIPSTIVEKEDPHKDSN